MTTTRRDLIKRAAATAGAAWVAPSIWRADPHASAACTCSAYKIDSSTGAYNCLAFNSASNTGGARCGDMDAAWVSKLGSACTTYSSTCPTPGAKVTISGVVVDWTVGDGDSRVEVTFPVGVTPVFLGARFGGSGAGCSWLNCGNFNSSCTSIATNSGAGQTCGTVGCTCMCWNVATRKFIVDVAGWSGATGISHIVIAWSNCGS